MGFALLVVLGTAHKAKAQDAKTPYPNMAAIEQYLMDRTEEITLAKLRENRSGTVVGDKGDRLSCWRPDVLTCRSCSPAFS
jgi:hypothetical protein